MSKTALVFGAAGFIGNHLVKRLKDEGYWVHAVDWSGSRFSVDPEFGWITPPDYFDDLDLRSLRLRELQPATEVYQLAAQVGGLGYIMDRTNDAEILHDSLRINLSILEWLHWRGGQARVFFASSACVYPSLETLYRWKMSPKGGLLPTACFESDAYPAHPDNEYAWEKLFAERLYDAYARNYQLHVRIGRLHNTYGTHGTYTDPRAKAPAAICRKVACASDGDEIEVWGDGLATRSFTYVDDTIEGIIRLTRSGCREPVNIGSAEMVTIDQLAQAVIDRSGKRLTIKHVPGPVGVAGRSSDNTLCRKELGWEPGISLVDGIARTYPWIAEQVAQETEDLTEIDA